eukprot:TRINITY_DN1261_c0_g1_i14.p1 TRINITY_DN1261_c0_g1~~TRINITY_DN1261_c0_g1_i14.p1  ORF type:complete len:237 (+),score=53.53 TRINITY_DN1261_c0_g1_i14:395-1105(+)
MDFLAARPGTAKLRTVRLLLSQLPGQQGYKDLCAALWISTGLSPGRLVVTRREEYLWPLVREEIIPNLEHTRTLVDEAVRMHGEQGTSGTPREPTTPGPLTNVVPDDDRTFLGAKPKRFVDTLLRILSMYAAYTGDGAPLCQALMFIPADTPWMSLWPGTLRNNYGSGLVSAREALDMLLREKKPMPGASSLTTAQRLQYIQSHLRLTDIAIDGQYERKQMGVISKALSTSLVAGM